MKFNQAPEIKERVDKIVKVLNLEHIDHNRIVCMRSYNSKSMATARIWSMPRIWQKALGLEAHYVIEVLSEKFDNMSKDDQDRTLIHELMHIPKTFSGALVPHVCFGKRINRSSVEKVYKEYMKRQGFEEPKSFLKIFKL